MLIIHFYTALTAQACPWWFVQGTCTSNIIIMRRTFYPTQCVGNRLWTRILVCYYPAISFFHTHTHMHAFPCCCIIIIPVLTKILLTGLSIWQPNFQKQVRFILSGCVDCFLCYLHHDPYLWEFTNLQNR